MANLRNDDPPGLLPPLPEWRREVRERVEAYRASHPRPERRRAAPANAAAPGTEAGPEEHVLPFRLQPALLVRTGTGSAEPIADPVPLAEPVPIRKPEPVAEKLESATEPAWSNNSDYLQLPLPMGATATVAAGRLPADVAPPRLRLQAGLTDAMVVIAAAVLFALAGWVSQNFPALSSGELRRLLPALVVVLAGLAALYLLLCAYAGGATVGMRRRGLAVRGWDGPLTPEALRRRGWASVVSLVALGLGFFWILCDRQHLSWHDAMSRTCVVVAPPEE